MAAENSLSHVIILWEISYNLILSLYSSQNIFSVSFFKNL